MSPAKKKSKAKPSTRKKAAAKKPAGAAKAARSRDRTNKSPPKSAKLRKAKAPAAPKKPARRPTPQPQPQPQPRPRPRPRPREAVPGKEDQPKSRLGTKYQCFSCAAKFYDLNKPEPTCPRCGVDQRDRPKETPKPKVPAPPRSRQRASPMAPLLDEEDDESIITEDEDLGLGRPAPTPPGDFLEETDAEEEEADEI
jgi:hypothetical protein